jgi:hypothetical protein
MPNANAPTLGRNMSSVRMATRQPPSTSPRTDVAGTRTSSKTSRPIGWGDTSRCLLPDNPRASPGTANAVIPRKPRESLSLVRANTEYTSASGAFEMNTFSPVRR